MTKAGAALAALALAAAITRLPQLLGHHAYPDGDECLLGLMARHFLEGRGGVPIFFWGQSYGLAAIELAAAALLFLIAGTSAVSLKIAMLLLWTIGCGLLAGAAARLGGRRAGAIAALLALFSPAWAQFSMKAWGGHLTSFLFTSLTLFVAAGICSRIGGGSWRYGLIGVSAGLVALSQPIWLFALAPFLALVAATGSGRERSLLLAGGFPFALLAFGELWARPAYWSPAVFSHPDPLTALILLPHRLRVNLSGAYYLAHPLLASDALRPIGRLWAATVALVLAAFVVRAFRGELATPRQAAAAGVASSLAATLAMNNGLFGFRYLLPVTAALSLSLALELAGLRAGSLLRGAAAGFFCILIGSGALALWKFRNIEGSGEDIPPWVSESRATRTVVEYLERQGIHDVYSFLPLLQWTLMFESRDAIQARWAVVGDRYPPAGLAVDRALRQGKPVAFVGTRVTKPPIRSLLEWAGYPDIRIQWIEGWYWVIANPPRDLVEKLFTLSPAA